MKEPTNRYGPPTSRPGSQGLPKSAFLAEPPASKIEVTPLVVSGAPEPPPDPSRWTYTVLALAVVVLAGLAGAAIWSLYPVHSDSYYHMAAVQGLSQAGGVPLEAFWEDAPGGRPHLWPWTLHAVGFLLTELGVTPLQFAGFISWFFYAACLLTTWMWMSRIAGPRSALMAVVLLCGPSAFFWNQVAHPANAAVLVVAPLALWALAADRYLLCAVFGFVCIGLHPMGLFLPPALLINTILCRKRFFAGLLAAIVPLVLFAPWFAHVWAQRAAVSDAVIERMWNVSWSEFSVGVIGAVMAVPALLWLLVRRGSSLALIGTIVGLAIVIPLGLLDRFLIFNLHWPLACLGGFGLGELLRRTDAQPALRSTGRAFAGLLGVAALVGYPSLDVRSPSSPQRPTDDTRLLLQVTDTVALNVRAAALPRLLEPNPFLPRWAGPDRPGAVNTNWLHVEGAEAFFDAAGEHIATGDVVFVRKAKPELAALVTGLTGARTSNAMLSEIGSFGEPARPQDCHLMVVPRTLIIESYVPPPPPADFEKLFENEYGSLWRNPAGPPANLSVGAAVVTQEMLVLMLIVALVLGLFDLLPRRWVKPRLAVAVMGTVVVAVCMVPLTKEVLAEIRSAPVAPAVEPNEPVAETPEPDAPAPQPDIPGVEPTVPVVEPNESAVEPNAPAVEPNAPTVAEITEPVLEPDRPAGPPPVPSDVLDKIEQIELFVGVHREQKLSPDYFWPKESQEQLQQMLEKSRFDDARELLDEALRILDDVIGGEGEPGPDES